MGDYLAPLSPVDIQKPPPDFQSKVLSENLKLNGSKRKMGVVGIINPNISHASVAVSTLAP